MYLVLPAITSSPVSLLATNKVSAFSFIVCMLPSNIQGDSKKWFQRACTSCRRYGLSSKRRLNTRQTVGCGIPSSLLALRVDFRGLRSKLLNSSHVLLRYTWSAGAFAFTQTAYLLKLVIPTTNALPR